MRCHICGDPDHEASSAGCQKIISAKVIAFEPATQPALPPCPICAKAALYTFVWYGRNRDGQYREQQFAECDACGSKIPIEALRAWQARQPASEQLRRAAALIRQGFSMLDEGRQILEEQTGP